MTLNDFEWLWMTLSDFEWLWMTYHFFHPQVIGYFSTLSACNKHLIDHPDSDLLERTEQKMRDILEDKADDVFHFRKPFYVYLMRKMWWQNLLQWSTSRVHPLIRHTRQFCMLWHKATSNIKKHFFQSLKISVLVKFIGLEKEDSPPLKYSLFLISFPLHPILLFSNDNIVLFVLFLSSEHSNCRTSWPRAFKKWNIVMF